MASSRWKRFAFFDKHTLNIPAEVIDDLLPVNSESRRNVRALQEAADEAGHDSVCMAVTTAALPLHAKPKETTEQSQEKDALEAMWSSLVACSAPSFVEEESEVTIRLPSQAQAQRKGTNNSNSKAMTSQTAMDGLVLTFLSSRDTDIVHCFDVTLRCNPPADKELEDDMDGWRGYFAPFSVNNQTRNARDATVADTAPGTADQIRGIATCRGTESHKPLFVACIAAKKLCVWQDPHLYLSCRRPLTSPNPPSDASIMTLSSAWSDGNATAVDIAPGLVAVGTDSGAVVLYTFVGGRSSLRLYLRIPPPPSKEEQVVSVKLVVSREKASVVCAYNAKEPKSHSAGICCYDLPLPSSNTTLSAPSARHDLDGRYLSSSRLMDSFVSSRGLQVTVARFDGLYTYSQSERIGVAPIDGDKFAICLIPPPVPAEKARDFDLNEIGYGYSLVASTDEKSGRDAVDIYDSTNKLVALHLLLSPGHKALRAAGVTTPPTNGSDGSSRNGRSSAVLVTSGGALLTITEKSTAEKIALLVQKNLYSAAIVVAYSDPSFEAIEITKLYRQYAEHLYRKGDYNGSMEQYINTIGSLESSHVIFRFLDAPKIPLLVKYLEKIRERELATPVHNELLRTCYLKLNDTDAAEALASTSSSINKSSLSSILSNLTNNPKEALATICSLDAQQAAEVLVIHGAALVRVLPRETAGLVIALCLGTFSSKALADAALNDPVDMKKMIEPATDGKEKACEPYPVSLFASAFIEQPKLLRMVLAHCNRSKCHLTPSLRRTLLELSLEEWNQAKRSGDTEAENHRRKEAIAALTDSHCRDIGDCEALVIVQRAGFEEGEVLLYERLQMTPMLLEHYAKEGSEKSRRQMLAMCQTDPDILADVLGHFVRLASEKIMEYNDDVHIDDDSLSDETEGILEDIQEALDLARRQGVLPPVRIARILAGEGTGQFSSDETASGAGKRRTVPLSVALDYVGAILEESRREMVRLKSEVEEYNQLCVSMEKEIDTLLKATSGSAVSGSSKDFPSPIDIDELYAKIRAEKDDSTNLAVLDQPREAFWREMNQSEDTFDVIARFFAKGVIR